MKKAVLSALVLLPLIGIYANGSSVSAAPTPSATSLDTDVITETITLHFVSPSALVAMLANSNQGEPVSQAATNGFTHTQTPQSRSLMPEGISMLTPNEVKKTLTISGSPKGIVEIHKIVRLIDVEPKTVHLEVRVLHYTSSLAQNIDTADVVATGITEAKNNVPVDLSAFGDSHAFNIKLAPHINGDGSVSLQATLASEKTEGSSVNTEAITVFRRTASGAAILLIPSGPANEKTRTYCLEVKPTVLPYPAVKTASNRTASGDAKLELAQMHVATNGK